MFFKDCLGFEGMQKFDIRYEEPVCVTFLGSLNGRSFKKLDNKSWIVEVSSSEAY
ncbi:hypothetical protein GCM10010832_08620 [Psychroflexus planctonicus]|uniref:Uncharacterized protein n=1 Tax=Psychroflexus planctonicus TaxID=1526575 RepID=A0ABQ1SFG6_9FLAO|nr:hypothetical protein GCM10010832_08620 [Psychroflexus planctonicus]